jgi:CheY-like chemotaxis protein
MHMDVNWSRIARPSRAFGVVATRISELHHRLCPVASCVQVGIADADEFMRAAPFARRADDMHVVAAVEDGVEAVALADSGAIDVVLLELDMPNMGGLAA